MGDCMIGLELTQGAHTLRFVYRNDAFRLSCIITGVSAGIFLLLVIVFYRPKKRHPEPVEPEPVAMEPEETDHPENEMPPLLPREAALTEAEEPFVLEELTRDSAPTEAPQKEEPPEAEPAGEESREAPPADTPEAPSEPEKAPREGEPSEPEKGE